MNVLRNRWNLSYKIHRKLDIVLCNGNVVGYITDDGLDFPTEYYGSEVDSLVSYLMENGMVKVPTEQNILLRIPIYPINEVMYMKTQHFNENGEPMDNGEHDVVKPLHEVMGFNEEIKLCEF